MNEAADDGRDKPATAMEDDLSENQNDGNFGNDSSCTEDDVIRATVSNLVTVGTLKNENDNEAEDTGNFP